MDITNLGNAGMTKLQQSIDSRLSSYRKRGISYTINTLNGEAAVVTLTVSGKKGLISRNFMIIRNVLTEDWTIHAPNMKAETVTLDSIKTIVNRFINIMGSTVNKM